MRWLDRSQIILLHDALIKEIGGAPGLRDVGALDSASSAPFQSFDGIDLYPTATEKIVRLAYGLIRAHAFVDGNKRVGTLVLIYLFELNDVRFSFCREEMEQVILGIASGAVDHSEFLAWCRERVQI